MSIEDSDSAATQANHSGQFQQATADEKIRALVLHLANMWSVSFRALHALEVHAPESLTAGEKNENGRCLQETSGLLYHFRDLLKAGLSEEAYGKFSEAASFDLYELSENVYRETGSLEQAAKAMHDELHRRYEAAETALQEVLRKDVKTALKAVKGKRGKA